MLCFCSQRSFRWEGSSDVGAEDPEPPGTPQEHCQSPGSMHLWRSVSILYQSRIMFGHKNAVKSHNKECFITRTSACDHRILQPWWPLELPSPEGWDVCGLCYEYSRDHRELEQLQKHLHPEAVHSKVHLWSFICCDLFLLALYFILFHVQQWQWDF